MNYRNHASSVKPPSDEQEKKNAIYHNSPLVGIGSPESKSQFVFVHRLLIRTTALVLLDKLDKVVDDGRP